MENKNLLGIIPNTLADLYVNYVLVKAPLLVRETEDGPKLVMRIMCVRETFFMENVPMDHYGHPRTNGGMCIEIIAGDTNVYPFFSGYYATKESGYELYDHKMDGKFITVLRESDGFIRGEKLSVASIENVKKYLTTAQRIVDALHQPVAKVSQCREIVNEYNKLPLKWKNVIDTVTFYNNK